MAYETFHYSTLEDVKQHRVGNWTLFFRFPRMFPLCINRLTLGAKTAPNRIAFQPMEGTDGTENRRARRADHPPLRALCEGRSGTDLVRSGGDGASRVGQARISCI